MSTNKYIGDEIYYPEGDGKPMADNTLQYEWIVTIKEGLEIERPNDFVAADLFWYPVKGNPHIHYAPDVMVAIGRPKGHRPSYKQWEEENIAPQVVFEILSPCNTIPEMIRKFNFYNTYGVQEYYIFDPQQKEFFVYCRHSESLAAVDFVGGWVSPLLGIRFQFADQELKIFHTNGEVFLSFPELRSLLAQERQEKQIALANIQEAEAKAQEAEAKAEQERQEKEKLKEKLRQLGIDPDSI